MPARPPTSARPSVGTECGPAHCVECHSGSRTALEKLAEGEHVPLSGGLRLPLGPLGAVHTKNLTPDTEPGIGRYSDGQIARMTRYAGRENEWTTMGKVLKSFVDITKPRRSINPRSTAARWANRGTDVQEGGLTRGAQSRLRR